MISHKVIFQVRGKTNPKNNIVLFDWLLTATTKKQTKQALQ